MKTPYFFSNAVKLKKYMIIAWISYFLFPIITMIVTGGATGEILLYFILAFDNIILLGAVILSIYYHKSKKANNAFPNKPRTSAVKNRQPAFNGYDASDTLLMLSQYAAHYVYKNNIGYANEYKRILNALGFNDDEAQRLLAFECDILKRFNKQYLLDDGFTKAWLFSLSKPFFTDYPKEKDDILKERFLTLSELCKIVDEAEWHFWNSHERELPKGVWEEIFAWHLKGAGAEFAIKYFETVAEETGIPEEKIGAYSSREGAHLSKHKWGK